SNVVWVGNSQIFLYDGASTTRLSENNYAAGSPQVSGSNVVWQGYNGDDSEIFLYDGTSTTQLTDNSYDDRAVQISGANVVWEATGIPGVVGSEIFLFNGVSTIQLTNNSSTDGTPQVSGSNVVWQGHDGHDSEIFLYDGTSTTQLTDNDYTEIRPQISGSNVVWWGKPTGDDYDVFMATPDPSIDFNEDGNADLIDVNLLTAECNLAVGIPVAPPNARFDLNSDDMIDTADLDRWLEQAATINGYDSPYLKGDTNLNGEVDVWEPDGTGDAQVLSSNLGTS
ncbi:unnamed protein product, partial [marine sediment metagenome]